MNRFRSALTAARDGRDDGMALATVVIFGAVLFLLVATAAGFASSGIQKAGTETHWNAAMSAAYAGVEDYKSRLASNADYVNYRNPASTFGTAGTGGLPPTTNPAFGLGASGTWATVPTNSGEVSTESFRYEVDNSKYDSTGVISLRSTGRSGNSVRSIVANVKQQGFINFLYFTDYEVSDPTQSNQYCDADNTKATVGTDPQYAWQRPSPYSHVSNCTEIQFVAGDTLNGPVHSNDTMLICGGTFNFPVSSSDPIAPYYKVPTGCPGGTFKAGAPTLNASITMPPSNGQMKLETHSDLATVQRPGCLYTGPTNIVFTKDGNMTVTSPFTIKTNVAGDGNPSDPVTSGTISTQCGTPGTATGDLGSPAGATIPVIPQNMIFVQNVPATVGDPNYAAPTYYPPGFVCSNTSAQTGWTFGALAYPMANETVPAASPAHYGCRNGDAYVQGVLHGAVTVASDNYIYVTGDLTYSDPSQDILGLVGNNAVWVWNPFNGNTPLLTTLNRTIDAAILSVDHTFGVQNYSLGASRGNLYVNGAIAQKFRGAVGTSGSPGTGYLKQYNYDTRFMSIAPPKFLSPTTTTYGITTTEEVPTAFTASGVSTG